MMININIIKHASIMISTLILTSCQSHAVPITNAPYALHVNQGTATYTHPAEFYLCGNAAFPCTPVTSNITRSHTSHISKKIPTNHVKHHLSKEKHHERFDSNKKCNFK